MQVNAVCAMLSLRVASIVAANAAAEAGLDALHDIQVTAVTTSSMARPFGQ